MRVSYLMSPPDTSPPQGRASGLLFHSEAAPRGRPGAMAADNTVGDILIIDPDRAQSDRLGQFLGQHNLAVRQADSVEDARSLLAAQPADLVILEVALPNHDGLRFCQELQDQADLAILICSDRCDPLDCVAGLEFGADDYVAKTCHPLEILARVRALLRRARRASPDRVAEPKAQWRYSIETGAVQAPSGEVVWLANTEALLFSIFARQPGEILSREQLRGLGYGRDNLINDRSVDVIVMRIRRKLARCPGGGDLIRTSPRRGYVLTQAVTLAN